MAGETEVDEPLAVERAGHLFENLDAPLVVFDQIVVSRQDACDSALDGKRRDLNFGLRSDISVNATEPASAAFRGVCGNSNCLKKIRDIIY